MTVLVLALATSAVSAGNLLGDPRAGEEIYRRCLACHALAYDRTARGIAGFSDGGLAACRAFPTPRR